ncbi:hypothetical conserved protein [Candidatus Nitrosoglobus terrae]|uniref:Hypothetical conserved protein n=1 Tax=Candidatus Nitrosoglobus terrae TaxID=1630141 RepID=A0A1Q2SNJ5_9GAMM|nr:hypothetical protein [Candidatus Nitrosoglobus terrae]BAW80718.1 hypothetical conserved protein [Candidatus Nitrosoglobus terrae]
MLLAREEQFFAALKAAGMPTVPNEFSVVPLYQVISKATLTEIKQFIHVFERVTTRPSWQEAVSVSASEIARHRRAETCFFSAWDFHLPPNGGPQVIEFNDNGSGLLFGGLINDLYYQFFNLSENAHIQHPCSYTELSEKVISCIKQEVTEFFDHWPQGIFLILEDSEVLQTGKFRYELTLLRDLFRQQDWSAEIGAPEETSYEQGKLFWRGEPVSFIVNRSTDFLWQTEAFSGIRNAYELGKKLYIAPNPFTYVTRSNKRLLEPLSLSDWDQTLGIQADERAVLSAHVPETHLLRSDNLDKIAQKKEEFIFKPAQGFAAQGLLASTEVGRSRLRRLLREDRGYVAQKKVPKNQLSGAGLERTHLWADLRVWAYRGEILLLSGRASIRPDGLDLSPPGGWIPTYIAPDN